jgi:serine/threonine-protein kinase RsbW
MIEYPQSVSLEIPALAEYIDIARLSLYGIADKMGFSYEEIEDMKVAVAEACNNAVLHACEGNTGTIAIRFEMKESELTISVKDDGLSYVPDTQIREPGILPGKELLEFTAGGLGLYLMQALMDKVDVQTGQGTLVVLTKFRSAV